MIFVAVENRDCASCLPEHEGRSDSCRASADDGHFLSAIRTCRNVGIEKIAAGKFLLYLMPSDRYVLGIEYAMSKTILFPVTHDAGYC